MYLKEYISSGGALYSNSRGIFDESTLSARITCLFSYRTIRGDMSPEDIAAAGQSIIDTQEPFLRAMFDVASKFNPFGTARREITHSGAENTESATTSNKTNTGTRTTTNTGTTTSAGNMTDTPTATTTTTKSAFNATESRPAETVTNSGTNTAETTNTTTNDLTDTTTDDLTEAATNSGNNNRSYNDNTTEVSVSSAAETEAAFRKYIQPYDYLAREIVNATCEAFW